MNSLQLQIDRIRRRLWLVLGIASIATIAAIASSIGKETTYTARQTMRAGTSINASNSPDQRAVLARDFVARVNELSYQDTIRDKASVNGKVDFEASALTLGPLFEIRATSRDAKLAESAATAFANAFVADVRASLKSDLNSANDVDIQRIKNFSSTLADVSAQLTSSTPLVEQRRLRAQITSLQTTIAKLEGNITASASTDNDRVSLFGTSKGVIANVPGKLRSIILALVGGLILGGALALLLGSLDRRLTTPSDVRDRLGLETLAVITGGSSATSRRLREQDLKRLANVVALTDLQRPATIAITSARSEDGKQLVAAGLAAFRGLQGERTILMEADLHDKPDGDDGDAPRRGVADFLATRRALSVERLVSQSSRTGLSVIPPGRASGDPYALFARDRFGELVEQATALGDLLVIEAPPIRDAAESQVICQAADRTIIVATAGITQSTDVAEAAQLLEQVGASVLGVVLVGAAAESTQAPSLRRMLGRKQRRRRTIEPALPDDADDLVNDTFDDE